ncbi:MULTISPECIES: methylmalonyl-CoA mutase subunit beta [Myroides]|uniref:Methylmalonyl-CoA mutase n=1 Tax=Myroides albus TaxID=2562892 RepID=A0A6I3LK20_9FLAO|nr:MULTISPECIES: methylmalonyl-CoA mutase subunit beta [Myroides]MTG98948.1 methylmalonyl-CoA mutase [Myroides albus]MVX35518.1 methylmalonyl-CoA mutase [Myroides sp. LoEW2-1]UVD78584.1 methylmalonyl-CoA mutase subunit beta [Myroides albus]
MNDQLFEEFNQVSSKEWKNKIQYELKGADYNETLIWESLEGIKVRPFYHSDSDDKPLSINTNTSAFQIMQCIYVYDLERSIEKAKDTLNRGADTIHFTIDNPQVNCTTLLSNLPKEATYYFRFGFLDAAYFSELTNWGKINQFDIHILIDPIYKLGNEGNWFKSLEADFNQLNKCLNHSTNLLIDTTTYQNAGANMVQQIGYALAHVNEYLNRIEKIEGIIYVKLAVGTNYFFEIAKLRALRMLLDILRKEYTHQIDFKIIAIPTKRNKTLYDYNVNMLRTTTECMSAILGGADLIANLAYDSIYHKENEFGDRIARNQLLILKKESYFDAVNNPAEGAYYIENITLQLAQKALDIFKQIEKGDGLITSLIEGTIQRKINESAAKEQELFDKGEEVLLGTNKYPNQQDHMSANLELYPFIKQNPRKTLVVPIIERRLAEKYEQQRLAGEESIKIE